MEESRRVVHVYVTPDPDQWGARLGTEHVLRPEEVVHA
jgi:hypothetical protein